MSSSISPLAHPVCFQQPDRLAWSSWLEHVPFAMYLTSLARPAVFVELGTYRGTSYCAFCQAVDHLGLDTKCFAIDTWRGDPQSGTFGDEVLDELREYHDPRYSAFSVLVQRTFDEALDLFSEGEIDLLHVDGYHTYEAVSHDFESWLPKMSPSGVVLLHDVAVHQGDFGVHRLWEELDFPKFAFEHGHGLGVVAVGAEPPQTIRTLSELPRNELMPFARLFQRLGQAAALQYEVKAVYESQAEADRLAETLRAARAEAEVEAETLRAALADALADADRRVATLQAAQAEAERELKRIATDHESQLVAQAARVESLEAQLRLSAERSEALAANLRELNESEAFRVGRRIVELVPLSMRLRRRQRLSRQRERIATSRLGRGGAGELSRATIGVVAPVFNSLPFLDQMMSSLANSTRVPDQVVLVNDCSTQEGVAERLRSYVDLHPFVSLIQNETNLGVSESTNLGIRALTTDWVAFVDCDDFLSNNALERVAEVIDESDVPVDFIYTNRVDVNERGEVVREWDFSARSTEPPYRALLQGMFTSHLKVVRAATLQNVGLFRRQFDLAQDYDLSLRIAESGASFRHIAEPLYFHRVHPRQQTQQKLAEQERLGSEIAARSKQRMAWREGASGPTISVVMLVLDRPDVTQLAVETLLSNVRGRLDIVLLDNQSDAATRHVLGQFHRDRRVTILRSDTNLGCAGGRSFAAGSARGDYLFFVDNDMEFTDPDVALKLVERLEAEPDAAACCCKVVFPTGTIQFNGAMLQPLEPPFVKFELVDEGLPSESLATLRELECDWIPGGATMWRRSAYIAQPARPEMLGAFEDNEHSLRVRRAGWKLLNAPTARVVHHHYMFGSARSQMYEQQRYDRERILASMAALYRDHGVLPYDQGLFDLLNTSPEGLPSLVRAVVETPMPATT